MKRFVVAALIALLAMTAAVPRAGATVNSTVNKTIVLGTGAATQFTFSFIGVAAAYIGVIYTDASGNETVLTQGSGATQYQIALNAPVQGAIWGLGGTVTYNPSGTPIAAGTTLTIFRTLPLTQAIVLQNQSSIATLGKGSETGLDTSVMQAQQISENIARAIVAPIVDATPPLPLPPIAQRANQGAGFDSAGNMVAVAAPASGIISSAMQPVVDAATLALGRTAFGLGTMATEAIGAGLQDDGSGNVRVNSALVSVAINQTVDSSYAQKTYIATGPITFALARANTLWNGFAFEVIAFTGPITFTPNGSDNFPSLGGGASLVVPQGTTLRLTTDAAATGTWYAEMIPQLQTPPQGYLTPCSQTVVVSGCTVPGLVPTGDVTAVSTLYYQRGPVGDRMPLWNGANMIMVPLSELVLTLNASHLANTLYDVCISYNAGVPTIMTAPAWTTSTAALGNRGTAAAITRTRGLWTNNLAITGRNGASTYSISANQCTMVGTISIGSAAGQVSFHRTYGQSRRWDAWNFYNRQPIYLQAGDATASWTYATATIRASRGDANNKITVFTGLPEEIVNSSFIQKVQGVTGAVLNATLSWRTGIGLNSTTAFSGQTGYSALPWTIDASSALAITHGATTPASYALAPAIGINVLQSLEITDTFSNNTVSYFGTNANMVLTAAYRG